MPRLFLGQREADFFSDITKEIIKDVAGQKIYYYTVREDLSDIHDVYEESLNKIFNPPALQASWTGFTEIITAANPPKAV